MIIITPSTHEYLQELVLNPTVSSTNLQEEIRQFIIDNGGQATIIPKTAIRFDKTKLKEQFISSQNIRKS